MGQMETWVDYVKTIAGHDATQKQIATRSGVDQTTISRWYNGENRSLTLASVTRFAHGYKRPVLEALVAAGLITEKDARVRVIREPLSKVPISELVAELADRTAKESAS